MRVDHDHALLRLPEDFGQPNDGHNSGIDQVAQHIARADRWQLICIAHENEPRAGTQGAQKRTHQENIHHAHFVYDHNVGVQRIVRIAREPLSLAAVFEQTMQRSRRAAGRFGHSLCRTPRRRAQLDRARLSHQANDAVD